MTQWEPKTITSDEKAKWYTEPHYIRIDAGVPCTTDDCLNLATVARLEYDPIERCFYLIATCRVCTEKQAKKYGIK